MMHARRDAAFYAHIGNEPRFYGPARRVVAAQELHLLLVGAHGRRALLAEGGHGGWSRALLLLSKECCSLCSKKRSARARAVLQASSTCFFGLAQAYAASWLAAGARRAVFPNRAKAALQNRGLLSRLDAASCALINRAGFAFSKPTDSSDPTASTWAATSSDATLRLHQKHAAISTYPAVRGHQ